MKVRNRLSHNLMGDIQVLLKKKDWTLSVAESLTCGLVQDALGQVDGISDVFMGGMTAYSLLSKVTLLGVEHDLAKEHNCVHPDIARQMADGIRRRFATDVGIGTTGYAVPDSTRNIDTPIAYISVVTPHESIIKEINPPDDIYQGNVRDTMRCHVTEQVLIALLMLLKRAP